MRRRRCGTGGRGGGRVEDCGLISLNFEAVREIFWKTNDMGHSRARSDGWELQVTWPLWLGIFWGSNRIKRLEGVL